MSWKALFDPRGVAVVGSVAPGKLGQVLLSHLAAGGFEALYAVNQKAQGLDQIPGFSSVKEIEAPIDLAVIASPAATVKSVLEDCGAKGVKAAVIITSGFSEAGNAAGEEELKQTAKKYGIRFVGPNCAGILNTSGNLMATLQAKPPGGGTAVISQSGALGGSIMALAESQGLGISKFVSYGNGADLNQTEFLGYLKADPETRVIALYIENITDGREFMEQLKEAARVKPVVVIKSGRTGAGQRAALSHTGSLAGSDAVYDAVFQECGAIRVETLDELFDLCKGFSYLPAVGGRRLAVVTNSGGPGVMAADQAEGLGLEMAEPDPALQEALRSFLPSHAGFKNPFDLTVEATGEDYCQVLTETLKEYDAAVAIFLGPPYLGSISFAQGILKAARQSGKTVAPVIQSGCQVPASVAYLREHDLPNFSSGERAVRVIARMAEYESFKARVRPVKEIPAEKGCLFGNGPLLEPDGMALLRENGIPVPEFRFAVKRLEAIEACRSLGYPVAMKVVSPRILHKSDLGGVVLNIDDDAAAGTAFDRMEQVAANLDFRGVVVYPMLRGGREVILGLTRDAQFGPLVAFGLGGVYAEALKDIVLKVAPVDRSEAAAMIRSIRAYPILQGIRGERPANLEALAEAIVNFSRLPFLYPDLAEADLNPVFVLPTGVLVGDVRLIGGNRLL
jgi:acyl-CoA synthetase (NDP forming)